ncbi:MAG: UTP--glucose-1-phosphate uridylyltransferase [Candidatus Aminicenantes bacterium]|nr:UTP--glucose-1-phosphate uridylyltransferase [Candidatus Aminicenantes bacterium]
MNIRKAVIPAAGFGTRFLPASKALPKEMLNVVDKPLIQYCVEEAAGSGLDKIGIVTSRGKAVLEDHFDRCPELEALLEEKGQVDLLEEVRRVQGLAEITAIRQPQALGLGHAILMGETFVAGEPFAALTPDDIYDCETPCTRQLVEVFLEKQATVIVLGRVDREGTKKYGIVKPKPLSDRIFRILDMAEKPGPEKAFSDLGILGRYVFTPEIFDDIRETPPDGRGEIQITDAIRLHLRSRPVYGLLFEGRRFDCGDKFGYLEATVRLALKRPEFRDRFRSLLESALND